MSEILQLEKNKAIKAYNGATAEGKTLLIAMYGADVFSQKITDRVKTFEDALQVVGMSEQKFINSCAYLSEDETAYRKLKIIVEALNEGWKPNWDNSNEYKYYPFFTMGNGFSFFNVNVFYQLSYAPSRLCLKTSALAEYCGKTFTSIYKAYQTA